ncbi:hypothetical protein PspLS_04429 [Pyricularia sp. CBS 133598]|nr:hypothetical protein PspLS_04429 [Pyricularia sp. CBS 133598]
MEEGGNRPSSQGSLFADEQLDEWAHPQHGRGGGKVPHVAGDSMIGPPQEICTNSNSGPPTRISWALTSPHPHWAAGVVINGERDHPPRGFHVIDHNQSSLGGKSTKATMAIKGYTVVRRKWKARKPIWALMAAELLTMIPLLVLFGIAQPDTFRTLMWRIGHAEKLNSNPNIILYAMANHQPMPKLPFVWSQLLTEFNVVISVISLFFLLAKMIGFIMKIYYPVIAVGCNIIMTAFYAVSVYGQAGPDYLDPRYPSPVPWYLRRSCDVAEGYGAGKTCMIIQGTFAATVIMLCIYVINLGWAIFNMIPTKHDNKHDEDEDVDEYASSDSPTEVKTWEMQPQIAGAGGVPFTPRTQAFHTLDRKLPFRAYAEQRQQYA